MSTRRRRIWLMVAVFLLLETVSANLFWRTRLTAPHPPVRTLKSVLDEGLRLRIQGKLADATALYRSEYARTRDAELRRELLGVVEDTGRADDLVREARASVADYPADAFGAWMLARGLLFQAATAPADAAAPAWIEEAERLTGRLEQAHFRVPDAPGALAVLRAQIAVLRHQWEVADRQAARALTLGVNHGEGSSLRLLRCDLNLRTGRLHEAAGQLDQVAIEMDRWDQGAYYMLREVRDEVMILRMAYFGKQFTRRDLDRVEGIQEELTARGFVEPTAPLHMGSKRLHTTMRAWIKLRERGDVAGQLELLKHTVLERLQRNDPPSLAPRCFYERTVIPHLMWTATALMTGDLCCRQGNLAEARKYYRLALDIRPGDCVIEKRLRDLEKSSRH